MTTDTKVQAIAAPWKKDEIEKLKVLMKEYPVIAIADLANFPASLFQVIRKKLQGKAVVRVSRMRLIKLAVEQTGTDVKNIIKLNDSVKDSCAIIFSKMNAFELYAFLKKNKGSMYAKAGAIADEDVTIPAMDTGLPPGPALSDLKGAGLKTKIEGGTIHIAEDKVVTKKGEEFKPGVVGTLAKLDIKPMKVGLSLTAALEDGELFDKDTLDIDADETYNNFVSAVQKGFNLAMELSYVSAQTIEPLIMKAQTEALNVGVEAKVLDEGIVDILVQKANAQAKSLSTKVKLE